MASTDVLARSAKGDEEIATKAHKLSVKHRSILIMIDGKTSEAGLLSKASSIGDVANILKDLEQNGFIERKAGQAPAPAYAAAPAAGPAAASKPFKKEVLQYLSGEVSNLLGPEGESLAMKIERCKTNAELAAMIDTCRDMLAGMGRKKKAEEIWQKAKEMMAA